MKKMKYLLLGFLLSLAVIFGGCDASSNTADWEEEQSEDKNQSEDNKTGLSGDETDEQDGALEGEDDVEYGESYTSKEEVALYLHLFEELPPNFITKKEAQKLGWNSKEGNLSEVAPGMSIGGDYFGNYEGNLPEGKDYHECDIDSDGGYRNAKRIVYSEDGCIYYTEDHYETFELLYGEE